MTLHRFFAFPAGFMQEPGNRFPAALSASHLSAAAAYFGAVMPFVGVAALFLSGGAFL